MEAAEGLQCDIVSERWSEEKISFDLRTYFRRQYCVEAVATTTATQKECTRSTVHDKSRALTQATSLFSDF